MKNPNLAIDIFKILLSEHISNMHDDDDCFTNKPDFYLDKYKIDSLITSSFKLTDQLLPRIDEDPEWKAIQAKNQAMRQQQASPTLPPKPPAPDPKPKSKKP